MPLKSLFVRGCIGVVITATLALPSHADELRNVRKGSPVPAYHMPAIDGSAVTSESLKGTVVVLVCLSAEQRRSEQAAIDSFNTWQALGDTRVQLIHVTADIIQKSYFENFRQEQGLTVPLAFDADRAFFGKLGLIVLPTTIVIDAKNNLSHVISLHSRSYNQTLEAYIKHTLGDLSDEELEQRLATGTSTRSTPKGQASAHRALARSMRGRGMLDTARAQLLKAREQDPESYEIVLDLADLDIMLGDVESAGQGIDLVLKSQPNHRRAQLLKGVSLFQSDQFDEAEAILNEALKLNPNPEKVHYYLGRICERDGRTKEALEHYHEALRLFLREAN
jgi:tetratricopeptide (TPR) repeat protein